MKKLLNKLIFFLYNKKYSIGTSTYIHRSVIKETIAIKLLLIKWKTCEHEYFSQINNYNDFLKYIKVVVDSEYGYSYLNGQLVLHLNCLDVPENMTEMIIFLFDEFMFLEGFTIIDHKNVDKCK